MTTPKKGRLPSEPTREDQFRREVPSRSIPDLLAALAELETATRPQDGAEAARGKDRKAVTALALVNHLVRAVAGWAIDHQLGLALRGEASPPDVLPELKYHPLNRSAIARVDSHRHEVEGARKEAIPPAFARKALLNLLRTNPGAFPKSLVSEAVGALIRLDYNEIQPIFRPRNRRKISLRELYGQLDALAWVAHYVGRGFQKNEALQRVSDAFGVSTATIRSWNRRVRTELGALTVEIHLEAAGVYDGNYEDAYDKNLIASGKDYRDLLSEKK
jgi:hypothetical protein